MTVGTVSGLSVPFDLGEGDDLPVVTTAITAQVPDEEIFVVDGDEALSVAAQCANGGTVVFAASDNSTIFPVPLTTAATSYVWTNADGGANPLAGGSVTKVFLSQPSAVIGATISGIVQSD